MSTWTEAKLGDLCEVTTGGTPPRARADFFGGTIPWVKIGDMVQGRISSTEETISQSALQGSSAKLLPPGTVLISIFATIGRTAVLDVEAATNQAIAGVTPRDSSTLAPRYLRLYLDHVATSLAAQSRGVAQVNINTAILKSLSVPLPSLAQQLRIAEVLDHAEALRAKRREAIARLNSLTQSIFLDMFGDPATNPKRWQTHPLGEVVAEVQIGPFGSLMHQSDYVDGGIPLVNPMHIVDGKIAVNPAQSVRPEKAQSLTRYWLREGDIVIGRRGEMGRCAVVGKAEAGMICGSGSAVIRPDVAQARPTFLQALLSTSAIKALFERKALGVTMLNLNSAIIADVVLMVPPMRLQVAYEEAVQKLETTIQASVMSLTHLDALFRSLQRRAFRGEL